MCVWLNACACACACACVFACACAKSWVSLIDVGVERELCAWPNEIAGKYACAESRVNVKDAVSRGAELCAWLSASCAEAWTDVVRGVEGMLCACLREPCAEVWEHVKDVVVRGVEGMLCAWWWFRLTPAEICSRKSDVADLFESAIFCTPM